MNDIPNITQNNKKQEHGKLYNTKKGIKNEYEPTI
ncbi:hypothetical protein HmCmsJML031_01569 [Escherichia coli]|nr:hypothetical protein HmCmsJML031_01569 [Escherichia coli]